VTLRPAPATEVRPVTEPRDRSRRSRIARRVCNCCCLRKAESRLPSRTLGLAPRHNGHDTVAASSARSWLVSTTACAARRPKAPKSPLPAGATAARDSAALRTPAASKPASPNSGAEESLAELRALTESAGAEIVGEVLQHRDRPDPATAHRPRQARGNRRRRRVVRSRRHPIRPRSHTLATRNIENACTRASSTAPSSSSIFSPATLARKKASSRSNWPSSTTCSASDRAWN